MMVSLLCLTGTRWLQRVENHMAFQPGVQFLLIFGIVTYGFFALTLSALTSLGRMTGYNSFSFFHMAPIFGGVGVWIWLWQPLAVAHMEQSPALLAGMVWVLSGEGTASRATSNSTDQEFYYPLQQFVKDWREENQVGSLRQAAALMTLPETCLITALIILLSALNKKLIITAVSVSYLGLLVYYLIVFFESSIILDWDYSALSYFASGDLGSSSSFMEAMKLMSLELEAQCGQTVFLLACGFALRGLTLSFCVTICHVIYLVSFVSAIGHTLTYAAIARYNSVPVQCVRPRSVYELLDAALPQVLVYFNCNKIFIFTYYMVIILRKSTFMMIHLRVYFEVIYKFYPWLETNRWLNYLLFSLLAYLTSCLNMFFNSKVSGGLEVLGGALSLNLMTCHCSIVFLMFCLHGVPRMVLDLEWFSKRKVQPYIVFLWSAQPFLVSGYLVVFYYEWVIEGSCFFEEMTTERLEGSQSLFKSIILYCLSFHLVILLFIIVYSFTDKFRRMSCGGLFSLTHWWGPRGLPFRPGDSSRFTDSFHSPDHPCRLRPPSFRSPSNVHEFLDPG